MRWPPHRVTLSNAIPEHQAGISKTRFLLNSSKELRVNHLKNIDFLYNEGYNTVLPMNNVQNYCSAFDKSGENRGRSAASCVFQTT